MSENKLIKGSMNMEGRLVPSACRFGRSEDGDIWCEECKNVVVTFLEACKGTELTIKHLLEKHNADCPALYPPKPQAASVSAPPPKTNSAPLKMSKQSILHFNGHGYTEEIVAKTIIYLASPYSHPEAAVRQYRYEQACKAAAWLMKQGGLVFSPIAHSHPIATNATLPLDWQYWKKFDEVMLLNAKTLAVLKLDEWEKSTGIKAEIEIAEDLSIPIIYLEKDIPE